MMKGKSLHILLCAVMAGWFLSSCSPQAVTMNVEMRQPSSSGLDLAGKSIAVVYLQDGTDRDEKFSSLFANGFADRLDNEYFGGRSSVALFNMPKSPGATYSSKDSLMNLVLDLNHDVVFLMDTPALPEPSAGKQRFNVWVYCYDSMNKEDKVYAFSGVNEVDLGKYEEDVRQAGYDGANVFAPEWQTESYTVIYYDSGRLWEKATQCALEFRWSDAIDCWLELVDTDNVQYRSCAEYNLALGCFMLGQFDLALQWLDRSDKDLPVSLSPSLRKSIQSRMKS